MCFLFRTGSFTAAVLCTAVVSVVSKLVHPLQPPYVSSIKTFSAKLIMKCEEKFISRFQPFSKQSGIKNWTFPGCCETFKLKLFSSSSLSYFVLREKTCDLFPFSCVIVQLTSLTIKHSHVKQFNRGLRGFPASAGCPVWHCRDPTSMQHTHAFLLSTNVLPTKSQSSIFNRKQKEQPYFYSARLKPPMLTVHVFIMQSVQP